jgi:hypothetical protein
MKQAAQCSWRILGFSLLLSVSLFAQPELPAPESPHRPGRFWNQLSDTQKSELQTLISTLREQDADHDAIRSAIHEKLTEWGIQPHQGLPERLAEKLTESQKKELEILISTLKSQNTAPREIHKAIRDQLNEWGIPLRPPRMQHREDRSPQRMRERSEGRVHPNPFNPDTHITYEISEQADVEISIFNAQGQAVRTYIMGNQAPGTHEITWDGQAENGELAPSGSYLYTIKAGKQNIRGHMLLMK